MKYSNNPFNIRFVKKTHWLGQIEPKNGFCQFDTLEHGVRAWLYLMCVSYLRVNPVMTIAQMIERYAPASDGNSTNTYITSVCRILNVKPFSLLRVVVYNDDLLLQLGIIMATIESNVFISKTIEYCIKVYKPKFPKV